MDTYADILKDPVKIKALEASVRGTQITATEKKKTKELHKVLKGLPAINKEPKPELKPQGPKFSRATDVNLILDKSVPLPTEGTRPLSSIKRIIMHTTEGHAMITSFRSLINKHVGVHYGVDRDGKVFQGASEEKITSHAYKNNSDSVGIEIANLMALTKESDTLYRGARNKLITYKTSYYNGKTLPRQVGDIYYESFAPKQLESIIKLVIHIHNVVGAEKPLDIVAHSTLSPEDRFDPGPLFPLEALKNIMEEYFISPISLDYVGRFITAYNIHIGDLA